MVSDIGLQEDKLAANFAVQPKRALEFSTKARVHGAASGASWESQPTDGQDDVNLVELRELVLRRDAYRCTYCHARSSTLQLDASNDNHSDLSPDNQVAACPLCHGYHHLGELEDGAAAGRVAYLPDLDSSDVNHLQRAIVAQLYGSDDDGKQDARELINWMASHSVYVAEVFGSDDPMVFASALRRVEAAWKTRRVSVFEHLSLIYNPRTMHPHAKVWEAELDAAMAPESRGRFAQDVMNFHE
jgi:hypothetical protein